MPNDKKPLVVTQEEFEMWLSEKIKVDGPPPGNWNEIEQRVLAALERQREEEEPIWGPSVFERINIQGTVTGRMSSQGNDRQNLPRPAETPPRCSHAIGEVVVDCIECGRNDFQSCAPGCKGWLHMDDPYEIQACDECFRFGGDFSDDAARKAHKEECGCAWPDFDYQHAAMAWMYDVDLEVDEKDNIQVSNASVLRNFVESWGKDFMENIIPAVFMCTQMIDRAKTETEKKCIGGLLTLYKEVRDKIAKKELILKDFEQHDFDPATARIREDFGDKCSH